jgi:hypothetical protein
MPRRRDKRGVDPLTVELRSVFVVEALLLTPLDEPAATVVFHRHRRAQRLPVTAVTPRRIRCRHAL